MLCVDEKTQIQALDRSSRCFRCCPGSRRGVVMTMCARGPSLYAALDVASGNVIGSIHPRHRAKEFLPFLSKIDAKVPAEVDVHV